MRRRPMRGLSRSCGRSKPARSSPHPPIWRWRALRAEADRSHVADPPQRARLDRIARASAAFGAGYPDRPVKLVVALAAGGPADTAARVFAPYLAEALGQSVFIENRTGASSVIGTEAVVRAAPDGYTLLFGSSSSFAVNPAVMKNLRFDIQKELTLVGLVSYTPHVLVVRASLPVTLSAISSRSPGSSRASSPMPLRAPAARSISPANCSSAKPASTWSTFPIAAAARP